MGKVDVKDISFSNYQFFNIQYLKINLLACNPK